MRTSNKWLRVFGAAAFALMLLTLAAVPSRAQGQDEGQEQEQVIKHLRFKRGSSSVTLNGRVRPEGNRYLYFFKARKGQRLTVRLVSDDNNAVCDLMWHGGFDANPIAEGVADWSGKLPPSDIGEYSIEVKSTGGLAKYVLEVSIR